MLDQAIAIVFVATCIMTAAYIICYMCQHVKGERVSKLRVFLYSLLFPIPLALAPVFCELIMGGLPPHCPMAEKSVVDCQGKTYTNWRYIQGLFCIYYPFFCVALFMILEHVYKLKYTYFKCLCRWEHRYYYMITGLLWIVAFFMIIPLGYIRNLILGL